MNALVTRSANPAIREAARGLVQAGDARILRAVAMVDALPDRGQADQIIAPLRSRLARLRPARPLRFARLLFLPLDPLIVPAARWRPEHPTIPRSVLPALAAAVAAGCGPLADAVAAMIAGRTTEDHAVVEAAGAPLWAAAGAFLPDSPPPPDWASTGLTAPTHALLARRTGALLPWAERLRALAGDAAQGLVPPEAGIIQALAWDAIAQAPDTRAMLIALLLARVPDAAPVLARAAAALGRRNEALLRQAGEVAADALLEHLEAPGGADSCLGGQDLVETAAVARRMLTLLGVLDGGAIPPGRRDRLHALRGRIGASAEALFAERLTADLLEPLSALAGPEETWALEDAARGLRALETEARRAGGGKTYDTLLAHAAGTVRALTEQGTLGRIGGVRLMEILAGPDVALTLFPLEA